MSTKGYYYLVLTGHLLTEVENGVIQWRFAEDAEGGTAENVSVVHPVTHGDMLKVYDTEHSLVWSGVVAYSYDMMTITDPDNPDQLIQTIDDKVVAGIQGSARPKEWLHWFERHYRARLEIRITDQNAPHKELERNPADPDAPIDRNAERERLIHDVLSVHDRTGAEKPHKVDSSDRKKAWWEE